MCIDVEIQIWKSKSTWLAAQSRGGQTGLQWPAPALTWESLKQPWMNVWQQSVDIANLRSCLPDEIKFIQSVREKNKVFSCGAFLISAALPHCFTSPSAGPCSEPAGSVQYANLRRPELGQTTHRQRGDPYLQVVLHWQKRWQRAGKMKRVFTLSASNKMDPANQFYPRLFNPRSLFKVTLVGARDSNQNQIKVKWCRVV